jgi:hypothetical protein
MIPTSAEDEIPDLSTPVRASIPAVSQALVEKIPTPGVQEIPAPVDDGFGGEAVYGELVVE